LKEHSCDKPRAARNLHRYLWLLLLCPWWAAAADKAGLPVFNVFEYAIEGNSVLPVLTIERAVYRFLGENKTITDVEAAREALEKAYHASGYLSVFVSIPEQKVDAGVVRLLVSEGEVERLRVTGSRYYSLGEIKARVPELAEGNVPYFPRMQEQLAGLGRAADRKVTPVLRPGQEPGKVAVDLTVADTLPFHGAIEVNNRYNANTTPWRLSGSLRWDNLWQKDHSIGISYQTAPAAPSQSSAISFTYSIPLPGGHYLAAYAVQNSSDVASLGTLGVIGQGEIGGVRWIVPLPGRHGLSHNLTLGVDYKHFDQAVLQGADSFNTPIRYLPFTVAWDAALDAGGSSIALNLAANFHIRNIAGDDTDFGNKRFRATSNYFYLRGEGRYRWQSEAGASVNLRAGFQLTDQPLISNEGYSLGGADTVRGYLESEALGDRGYVAGIELHTPAIAPKWAGSWGAKDIRALVFVETGRTSVLQPLPQQNDYFRLASAGVGLRLKLWDGLLAALDFVRPLLTLGNTRAHDARVLANLRYAF
jgi:hemolysin activation/secretion protein